jgi:hypothetical protein
VMVVVVVGALHVCTDTWVGLALCGCNGKLGRV